MTCIGREYELGGHFISPATSQGNYNSTFYSQSTVKLCWYAGIQPSNGKKDFVHLYLQSFNSPEVNQSIAALSLLYGVSEVTSSWTSIDDACADTRMKYTWQVPSDLPLSIDAWQIIVLNETSWSPSATSPAFYIRQLSPSSSSADSTATTTSATTSATTQPTATSSSTSPSPSPPPPGGLSTGAKAGIGIGCAIAVILAFAVVLLWYRQRREQTLDSTRYEKPELEDKGISFRHGEELGDTSEMPAVELEEHGRAELEAYERPVQLSAG